MGAFGLRRSIVKTMIGVATVDDEIVVKGLNKNSSIWLLMKQT